MSDIYSEILLDHYRLPRNKGKLFQETISVEGKNPLCGDEIVLHLKLDGERVSEVAFEGSGCAISMASASMLTEDLKGRTLSEVESRIDQFRHFIREGAEPEGESLNDMISLSGVAKLPVRVKCATLAWTTMEEALRQVAKK
ncbi:MAG: SUF system NifU family Fe-S cluster assembly protein [Calditrichaeota bacterium]|nr:SUF system NifU family Fe-S cluster assembly protein [Calditrichota bacterium]MCB9366914.1 SUF system NifU family Fe-S cluster assembly protein [Calditrichota bacterium]